MGKKKKNLRKRLIITLAVILIAVFAVVLPVFSVIMYGTVFGIRYSTKPYLMFRPENFPGLQRERYEFTSDEGQTLVGYRYYREDRQARGVIIMAHGIGGGHNSYMDCADYFTRNGYQVFAYDVTGNDESEGSSVRGLPQGVIDLDHAISFVEGLDEFRGLPIMLFGHSWGGYSCTSVLNQHPEVAAVCSVSGFNRSSDLLQFQGEQMVGPVINVMMPYLRLYERIRFGDYAVQTSMDGFADSDARVMIVHSEDDNTVGIQYGYDIYYEAYADDPDFEFIRYTDKGHSGILSSEESSEYLSGINAQFRQTFQGREPSAEESTAFYSQAIDMDIMATFADTELLGRVVAFYDETLGVTAQESATASDQDLNEVAIADETEAFIEQTAEQTAGQSADETVSGTAGQTAEQTEETTLESTDLTTSPVSEECSAVIEDMIVAYGGGSYDEAQELLQQVRDQDPSLADKWETILDMWTEYHDGPSVVMDALPEDLPQTGELCFVVLGYQLNYDGSMRDELIGRLEVALEAASSYPQAYIVCSGGGTAAGDGTATEAGAMAQWLIDNGIGEERVIIEDDSLSTTQNAAYTYEILARDYPQVDKVVLISSDYHIPMAVLIFEGQSLLLANDPDDVPYEVVANESYDGATREFEMAFWTGSLIELSGDEETAFAYYY